MNKDILIFKIIFGIAWGVAFVLSVGIAGGLECGLIGSIAFIIYELLCIAVMYVSYVIILRLDRIKKCRKLR